MRDISFFCRKGTTRALRQSAIAMLFCGLTGSFLAGCSDGGGGVTIGESRADALDLPQEDAGSDLNPRVSLADLGERLFNDTNLSSPAGQSCGSCHSEVDGFVDPDRENPSSLGANGGDFGNRNTPSLFYINQIPDAQMVVRPHPATQVLQEFEFGGFFIDGRAKTLEEQAKLPLFNTVEMALPSRLELVTRIQQSDYSEEFQAHFGEEVFDSAEKTLESVASALTEFQRSDRFSPFNSKFDSVQRGESVFTESEARGEALFNGQALCSVCHASPTQPELFSDLLYHNVGTPRNEKLLMDIGNPDFVDLGLGGITKDPADNGQFRTPVLRNVALTAPYMHNGVFGTLREVVEFYNSGTAPGEVPGANVPPFIGNLQLNETQVDDLVAYMNTFTDL
ncbi:MAG: cytochrome-c peroxidase [Granulosicoccus sp.]